LRENTLKARLKAGEATVGSWLSVAHPTIAEVMGHSGFDWLIADMEHGLIGLESLQTLVIATQSTPAAALVRVPWNEPVVIKQVLEAGPTGLIIPQVNSPDEARAATQAACYPPQGIRGIGCQRAAGFGAYFDQYLQRANGDLFIGIQIEHPRGVAQIREIVAVPGIDMVFVGANDLAASMGLLNQTRHPLVQEAIQTVLAVAREAGVAAGLMAGNSDEANARIAEGFQFVGIGHDVGLLSQTCRTICQGITQRK
jgi:2-keto-3-deoxy-L-rhamnonate aldolase RhmA